MARTILSRSTGSVVPFRLVTRIVVRGALTGLPETIEMTSDAVATVCIESSFGDVNAAMQAGLRTRERAQVSGRLLSTLPNPKWVSARCGGRSRLPLRGSPGFAPGSLNQHGYLIGMIGDETPG